MGVPTISWWILAPFAFSTVKKIIISRAGSRGAWKGHGRAKGVAELLIIEKEEGGRRRSRDWERGFSRF